MAKNKVKKLEKKILQLDSKGLRELQHVLNRIYIQDIKKRLKEAKQQNYRRGG